MPSFLTRMTLEEHYQAWRATGDGMDRHNIYARIAKKIELGEGVHVDIGFGPGHLLRRLCEEFPHAILLGLDTSPQMVEEATTRLRPRVVQSAKDKGHIELLKADFRKIGVVDKLLRFCRKGIDSSTYTFPGGEDATDGTTVPGWIDHFHPQEYRHLISHELRIKALGAVTAVTKAGGRFFLADRYSGNFIPDGEKARWQEILQHHEMAQYWTLQGIEILDKISHRELGHAVRTIIDPEHPRAALPVGQDDHALVGLLTFVREKREVSSKRAGRLIEEGLQRIVNHVIEEIRRGVFFG